MTRSPFTPPPETSELAEDVRRIFEELATTLRGEHRALSGECHPPLDVLETDETVEVVMDVSGVAPAAIRVVFKSGVLLIAGEKAPPDATGAETFHLVEREFGRFARGIRLDGAFDIARSRAALRDGELTIVLPKIADRRGRSHAIAVTTDSPA
jgi:HSP20 family protein